MHAYIHIHIHRCPPRCGTGVLATFRKGSHESYFDADIIDSRVFAAEQQVGISKRFQKTEVKIPTSASHARTNENAHTHINTINSRVFAAEQHVEISKHFQATDSQILTSASHPRTNENAHTLTITINSRVFAAE